MNRCITNLIQVNKNSLVKNKPDEVSAVCAMAQDSFEKQLVRDGFSQNILSHVRHCSM